MDEKKRQVQKAKGIMIAFHSGRLEVEANLSLSREKAITVLLLAALLLIMGSALSVESWQTLIEVLLSAVQILAGFQYHPKAK